MKIEPVAQIVADPGAKTFRRRVFYIPGYDPFHPRRYPRDLSQGRRRAGAAVGL